MWPFWTENGSIDTLAIPDLEGLAADAVEDR